MPQSTEKECILNPAPKSCDPDIIPSKLVGECRDSIIPSLTELFIHSLEFRIFPHCFKSALVEAINKNRHYDRNDLTNYRLVSNLCFIAKILCDFICIFSSLETSSCICTYMRRHLYVDISAYIFKCISVCISIHICIWIYMYTYLHLCFILKLDLLILSSFYFYFFIFFKILNVSY